LLAFAIAFTALVVDVTPVQAGTTVSKELLSTEWATAAANQEVLHKFTVEANEEVDFLLYTNTPNEVSVALYDSTGALVDDYYNNNPLTLSSGDYTSQKGYWFTYDKWTELTPGDYTWGLTFSAETIYAVDIGQVSYVSISQTTATITKGFTKKLEVSGAKVKSWSSSKKSVATVNSKGKVTAKKAGKATITATLYDGTKLKCKVTVKNNKYSATKYTTSNFSYGTYGSAAYAASYDSKGNLVVKVRTINNSGKTISKLKNIKVTVKNASGKTIGTYKLSSKDVSIPSGSVKDFSFTIKKSALKIKKKQDLRNAKVSAYADGYYTYTYYTYY
jgi:SLAP domain-containing protein